MMLLALVLLFLAIVSARMRPSEVDALWWLYEATSGAAWVDNTGWNPTTDPCRKFEAPVPYRWDSGATVPFQPGALYTPTPWYGVGCVDPCDDYLDGPGCAVGRATLLELRANGLSGNIAGWSSVGQLANLTILDLSNNSLAGSLPTQIGRLNNVHTITFWQNSLSGALPSELGTVNSNGAPFELKELSFSDNSFTGALPTELGLQTALQSLDVSNNSMTGYLPSELGLLTGAEVVYVQSNSLSGTLPPTLGDIAALRYLRFETNSLSGALPTEIGRLGELLNLYAHANSLSGTLPTQVGGLRVNNVLTLNDNSISGTLPSELGQMNLLETLDLYANQFTGDPPDALANLVNLKKLYLQNEQLLPVRLFYCQQRIPNVGKYSWRIVREEYHKMMNAVCPAPFDTAGAFASLSELLGDDG